MSDEQAILVATRVPAPDEQEGAPERARWELAALTGRLRTLDRELAEIQHHNRVLTRALAAERAETQRLRQSDTYRLGAATVELIRHPARSVPRLARAGLRRLKRRGRRTPPPANRTATSVTRLPGRSTPVRLPAHLYVAIGLEAETLHTFVRTLQQRLLVNADHVPVVVTDCPTFALLRNFGVIFEYLPDRYTWLRHRPGQPWDDVLSERLAHLYRDHTAVRTVIVDRRQPPTLAELLR
ncbi:MAG: hypothetical protein QOC94_4897 [Actinoplanes sp.]|jgi:hypothetical protein|nr:hypothetical protein [Actinoplanes sp.]